MTVRSRRATKQAPVPPKPSAVAPVTKSKAGLVRRAANSALLAAALAIAQTDDDETTTKWRLFDPHLLDRLSMPITRYHE
jgi:hypothetical protein